NRAGQLGDGSSTEKTTPVKVAALGEVEALAAGSLHSLALLSDGTVRAWGDNSAGQLGDGSFRNQVSPVEVARLYGVTRIRGGGARSLALRGAAQTNLGLTQGASRGRVRNGGSITYTLMVSNSGPKTVSGATVVDTLPQGATFLGASRG